MVLTARAKRLIIVIWILATILLLIIIVLIICLIVHGSAQSKSSFVISEPLYDLACGAIFKNEAWNLKEWLDHYIDQGVEHFYLINNASTDDFHHILRPYIDQGLVTLFHETRAHTQVASYNQYILPHAKQETEWLILCDLDEFIYARRNYSTILEYLLTLSTDVSVVSIPWKMFGSSGHKDHPKSGIIQNFTYRKLYNGQGSTPLMMNDPSMMYLKTISRPARISQLGIHEQEPTHGRCIRSDGTTIKCNTTLDKINETLLENAALHLNHYAIQSRDFFFTIKTSRGDSMSDKNPRNEAYFQRYDWNERKDTELAIQKKSPPPSDMLTSSSLGFIILRHIRNETHNQYWIYAYRCIRKHYPWNPIMIIDDHSDMSYVTLKPLVNTIIIQSEFYGRGEFLPYYYYERLPFCEKIVILQDSVFIQQPLVLSGVTTYQPLWTFKHDWNDETYEESILQVFDDPALLSLYRKKSLWRGIFGSMCVIKYEYLRHVHKKYDLRKLLDSIIARSHRMAWERCLSCLLQSALPDGVPPPKSLFGDIHEYARRYTGKFGTPWKDRHQYPKAPLLKIWSGR